MINNFIQNPKKLKKKMLIAKKHLGKLTIDKNINSYNKVFFKI